MRARRPHCGLFCARDLHLVTPIGARERLEAPLAHGMHARAHACMQVCVRRGVTILPGSHTDTTPRCGRSCGYRRIRLSFPRPPLVFMAGRSGILQLALCALTIYTMFLLWGLLQEKSTLLVAHFHV